MAKLALLTLSFWVFYLSPVQQVSDSQYSMLLSENLILHHSTHLDAYSFPGIIEQPGEQPIGVPGPNTGRTYQLQRIRGHVMYIFPYGSSVLALPFVAIANRLGVHIVTPDGSYDDANEIAIETMIAALLMAGLTLIIFETALLMVSPAESLVIALGTAFGTQIWSSASRALWSQTWFVLIEAALIFVMLKSERERTNFHPVIIATLLSWMYFVRPTAAVAVICLTFYMIAFHRRDFTLYAITGAAWILAFVAFSWSIFGDWLPGYYLASRLQFTNFGSAITGTLVSASRGLFVFVPIFAFVLYRVVRHWQNLPFRPLAATALAAIGLQWLVVAGYSNWWGGWSYGPRLMTEIVPWFALLAILGQHAATSAPSSRRSQLEMAVGLLMLALSILINARGAISWATYNWNMDADMDVDYHPDRVFDWSQPQFLAGLLPMPDRR
jgi:hypothetical protein